MRERAQLAMKDVSKAYGDRSVLDQVSLTVRPGEKAGVIGENGSGKSTLLRLLAGVERPDGGEITVAFPGGTGHLAQTLDLDPARTVQDAVDAALAGLRELERRIAAAEAGLGEASDDELAAYGDLLTTYEERGGYLADARVDAALGALGLARVARDRPLGSLSGGERSRLALACVLAAAPELLLLDEPTNHLDLQATTWLEDQLRAHRGTVLAVTHDRAFLERIATTILEVDRDTRAVTRYGDGWHGYRTAKAAARRRWEQDHLDWLADLARTEELVTAAGQRLAATGKDPRQGFGKHRRSHEAKLSGQVRAARQRLWRLRASPVPAPPEPLRFTATPASGDSGGGGLSRGIVVAELDDVVVGDRLRVSGLRIRTGDRLLVTGPNGAGKSTLLRVLAGELGPDSGTVRLPGGNGRFEDPARLDNADSPNNADSPDSTGCPDNAVRSDNPARPDNTARSETRPGLTGYLPQELPAVPSRLPLLRAFAAGRPGSAEEYEDELLALGLFRPDDLTVPVAALSVGQRRRLELARLLTRPADLLLLDEPTNHVALSLVEELEEALRTYAGAVVVVSHDRGFRDAFVGTELPLSAGRVRAAGTA